MLGMKLAGNIFLVGLMGAGKTTVGRTLARHTGKQFFDSDHEIEKRTGVRITTIFDIEGEQRFRERERDTIAELCAMDNIVLATGGGAILAPENRRQLASRGRVVYLRASIDELYRRTARDRSRPLLATADPRAKLKELLAARAALYEAIAHLVVDTGAASVSTVVQDIVNQLQPLEPMP